MAITASARHIIYASRIEALRSLPPFLLTPLLGLVSYRPMTEESFNRFVLPSSATEDPVGMTDACGSIPSQLPTQAPTSDIGLDDASPPFQIPAHLDDTVSAVRSWTKNLRYLNDRPARILLARQIRRQSERLTLASASMSHKELFLESNCKLALEYLAHMLEPSPKRHRGLKASTVASYWSNFMEHLIIHSHATNLLSLSDSDAVVNFVAGCLRTIRVPSTRATYRNKWSQFIQFLHPRGVALLNCHDPRMYIPQDHLPYPMLHYADIDRVIALISTQADVDIAMDLIQTAGLAGFLGLRLHEIHNIALQDVFMSQNLLFLSIPKSKSSAGIRTLPLSLLLPSHDLQRFLNHWACRLREANGDLSRPFLRVAEGGLSVNALGTRMASYIKQIHPESSLHDFRHTAGSCLLLAWWLSRHCQAATELPFQFTHRGFASERIARVRTLFDGSDDRQYCGGDLFDPILFAIARILGHASPDTTVSTYLHTFEIVSLLHQCAHRDGADHHSGVPALNQGQAANLLQRSSPVVAKILSSVPGAMPIQSSRVLEHQLSFKRVLEAQIALLHRHKT